MVRQIADEADRIGQHRRVASTDVPSLDPRRQRGEQLDRWRRRPRTVSALNIDDLPAFVYPTRPTV